MKDIDWAKLTSDLLESMVYTQSSLAEKCMVTQQSISNWKNGVRSPGEFARERLYELLEEREFDSSKYFVEGLDSFKKKPKVSIERLPEDVAEFAVRLSRHKKRKRKEVIALADFMLDRS